MSSEILTCLHVWMDKKERLHYLIFDSDGKHIGADEWGDAGRLVKELRSTFPDEFKELGGKDRIDPFIRAVGPHNSSAAVPALLGVSLCSIDLGTKQAIETTPGTTEVAYHVFSF